MAKGFQALRGQDIQGRRAFRIRVERTRELHQLLHIIDKATEHPPPCVPDEHWTYMLKFRAAWEAPRLEYQPSTVVDVSQLKEQIMSLSDQMAGGFDQFKAEFHRLHAEILAIIPRELNGVVRERESGILPSGLYDYDVNTHSTNQPTRALSALLTPTILQHT